MSHPAERQILGHPSGLFVLFFTEAGSTLQLLRHAGPADLLFHGRSRFNRTEASESYGATTVLVGDCCFGGMFADKIIGYRRSDTRRS